MRKSVVYLLASIPAVFGRVNSIAQCPSIANCPQGSPIICDSSNNDPLLWKEPPHTWSEVLQSGDLYESTVDLSLKIIPCAGGGLNISYELLLDLDNDDLLETVVPSNNPPPAGLVFANNAFNPGYAGGDPVVFDKRAVPDSLKFRFTLETYPIWDTVMAQLRWSTGNESVTPRLPEGKHRIKWRIQQGNTVKYCEHSFRVKDCLPPTLDCEESWSVNVGPDSMATVQIDDLVFSAQDNITLSHLLEFSIRKAGEGTGFPLNPGGTPVTGLIYDCGQLDSQKVELWAKDRLGNTAFCETTLNITDDEGICDVFPTVCAHTFWGDNSIVQQSAFNVVWADTSSKFDTIFLSPLPNNCAEMNTLPPSVWFYLMAENDNKHLNGVSTFDLLLITKHILGLQLFDAPWKYIAADANNSGSVTTFDVVELRKLLLGIYDKLPANTSWRFFVADCDLPPNPFTGLCPSTYSFLTTDFGNYQQQILFNALKVGDVNGTADPDSLIALASDTRGEPAFLQLPDWELEKGEVYDIPLTTADPMAWLGFQAGFQFDANLIEIETVNLGALLGMEENAVAQPQPGLLNLSWFSLTPQVVFPDEYLLTVRIRALADTRLKDVVSTGGRLVSEAYTADEIAQPLQLQFVEKAAAGAIGQTAIFPLQPNPTSAGAAIPIRLTQPESVLVEVMDFSGKTIFQQKNVLESGAQMLEIPASAFPQTSVYVWRVTAGEVTETGKMGRM